MEYTTRSGKKMEITMKIKFPRQGEAYYSFRFKGDPNNEAKEYTTAAVYNMMLQEKDSQKKEMIVAIADNKFQQEYYQYLSNEVYNTNSGVEDYVNFLFKYQTLKQYKIEKLNEEMGLKIKQMPMVIPINEVLVPAY